MDYNIPEQKTGNEVRMGTYLKWLAIQAIPVAGLVISIIWALDDSDLNRRNFFRASLVWMAIMSVIGILIFIIAGVILVSIVGYGVASGAFYEGVNGYLALVI